MSRKLIVAITDHREDINIMLRRQIEGIKCGVNIVIIRGYHRFSDLEKICNTLKVFKEDYDFEIIINAYPTKDLLSLKPDGFHLNGKNLRKVIKNRVDFNGSAKIGVSIHDIEEIKLSEKISPDYALISPIFQPSCKNKVKTLGIIGLENMILDFYEIYNSRNKRVPKFIALGGINKNNYMKLFNNTKLDGIALMSAIKEIKDIS